MAFTGIGGNFFLTVGSSTGFSYHFGLDGYNGCGTEDRGAQWAMAQPELYTGSYPEQGLAELAVSDFRKRGYWDSNGGSFSYGYTLVIANTGTIDTWFSVTGGGNV